MEGVTVQQLNTEHIKTMFKQSLFPFKDNVNQTCKFLMDVLHRSLNRCVLKAVNLLNGAESTRVLLAEKLCKISHSKVELYFHISILCNCFKATKAQFSQRTIIGQ